MFPWLYYAHHLTYEEDLPFWLDLAGRYGGPVLELGCGTGRVLAPLAETGIRVFGLDSQYDMLSVLTEIISPSLVSRVHLFQADMTAYHLAGQFPLILLPCNTFSTLVRQERRRVLQLAYRHLAPGGVFCASLPNPALLARLPAQADSEIETTFAHPVDSEPVQVSSAWRREKDLFIIDWHYDHLLPDGHVERMSVHSRHSLDRLAIYREDLLEAGFEEPVVYGDFERKPYQASSPHLILLANRPPSTSNETE